MGIDVSEFHRFYQTDLGHVVQQTLQHRLQDFWPQIQGQALGAYGYAIPYLEHFRCQASRIFNLMPAPMGVVHWPEDRPNLTALILETKLPLPDQCLDKLLLIHALEYTCHIHEVLHECWRVLNDGGKLLVVVPNRSGIWARTVSTPFGHGQPYTGTQLSHLLEHNYFKPERLDYCLYTPPTNPKIFSGMSENIESFGQRWGRKIGGIVMLQARKTVLAPVVEKTSSWGSHIFIPQHCEGINS